MCTCANGIECREELLPQGKFSLWGSFVCHIEGFDPEGCRLTGFSHFAFSDLTLAGQSTGTHILFVAKAPICSLVQAITFISVICLHCRGCTNSVVSSVLLALPGKH